VNTRVAERVDEIRAVVARVLEVDEDQLGQADHFVEQFGADSMKLIELLANLEIEFDVEVDPGEFERLVNLDGVYAVLSEALDTGSESEGKTAS
jgi:acyl carrier protein